MGELRQLRFTPQEIDELAVAVMARIEVVSNWSDSPERSAVLYRLRNLLERLML